MPSNRSLVSRRTRVCWLIDKKLIFGYRARGSFFLAEISQQQCRLRRPQSTVCYGASLSAGGPPRSLPTRSPASCLDVTETKIRPSEIERQHPPDRLPGTALCSG